MSLFDRIAAQIPFAKKEEEKEYIFALNIGLSTLTAAVWLLSGKHVQILSQANCNYQDTDDLVDKTNQVLDTVLGPLDLEPKRILFGVPDSWTHDDNLKEDYLKLLKNMLKEFELEPLAYVTTSHAITHLLQKQEGIPPTALVVGVGEFIEVALARGGKMVVSQSLKRSDRLFEDMEKILAGFNEVEVLPSKILVYPTEENVDLSKIKDELMSYPWMSKLPFLHFPRVEILPSEITIQALVLAGAVEIEPEIKIEDFKVSTEQKKRNALLDEDTPARQVKREDQEELGFVAGNIKDKRNEPKSDEERPRRLRRYRGGQKLPNESEEQAAEKGFSVREVEDLASDELLAEGFSQDEQIFSSMPVPRPEDRLAQEDTQPFSSEHVGLKLPNRFPPIFNIFKPLFGSRIMILLVILAALLTAYLFLVKASVTVFVEPKVLEKDAEVMADPGATSVDEAKEIIPGSIIETTQTGSDKGLASGSKQIGNPAKGKVVIYNKTNSALSLSQGATLSGNSSKFTLDTSVQIASQSGGTDASQATEPGTSVSLGVTASNIGPDSNLPPGTLLSVGSYLQSQVAARVLDDGLSGGTSKTVTVVTDDDQQKLQAQVIDNLKHQAANNLQDKVKDKKVIPEALTVVDAKYSFSKRVGDQATDFNLTATVHFKGTAYSETDLRTIVGKLVETNVPDGFSLDLGDSQTRADVEKVEKDGKLLFSAKFRANLLPKLDVNKIKGMIRGKSITGAADQLRSLDNVVGSEIKVSPSLPTSFNRLYRLPLLDNNISITIASK